jgi:hypothetical protein
MEIAMSAATLEKKAVKRAIFHVQPCDGTDGNKWDLHKSRTSKHQYFRTQKEALAAAHVSIGSQPAHVVMHARDGHAYREFDLN